jgi:hypothetical protein
MLADLKTFGDGKWPPGWRMRPDQQKILEALTARGLVTRADSFAELTAEGWILAHHIRPSKPRLDPKQVLA